MPDPAQGPISPELEELLAYRLARKALTVMAGMLTPLVLVFGWLGYDKYTDLTDRLDEATVETLARADTLKVITDSLRLFVNTQRAELAYSSGYASREADLMRARQEQLLSQFAQRTADERVQLLRSVGDAVGEANTLAASVREAADSARRAAQFARRAEPLIDHLSAQYESTNQQARQALRIAEEASVQTVGAGATRQLFGTPFDIYFSGITREVLRDVTISRRGGAKVEFEPRLRSDQSLDIPHGDSIYRISVVNILDIPAGVFRLNGSSRADAATFRITRIKAPAGGGRASVVGQLD